MPILTFWGVNPSGASARADLACRKGKKGAFSGAPGRVPKLSTIGGRLWITPGFLFAASRPLIAVTVPRPVPRSAATAAGMRPGGASLTGGRAGPTIAAFTSHRRAVAVAAMARRRPERSALRAALQKLIWLLQYVAMRMVEAALQCFPIDMNLMTARLAGRLLYRFDR